MNKGLVHYMFQLVDELGNAITSGASITVNIAGSTDATIYADADGTSLTNPITSTVFAALGNNTVSFWYGGPSVDLDIVHSSGVHTFVSGLSPSDARVVVDTNGGRQAELLYANTAIGAELADDAGVFVDYPNSYTLDGSALKAGDVIHIRGTVLCADFHSDEELALKVLFGTEAILSTGDVVIAADDDTITFDLWVTVNSVGATGTIMVTGKWETDLNGTVVNYIVAPTGAANEVTEDISGDVVIKVQGDYQTAHADQESYLVDLKVMRWLNGS